MLNKEKMSISGINETRGNEQYSVDSPEELDLLRQKIAQFVVGRELTSDELMKISTAHKTDIEQEVILPPHNSSTNILNYATRSTGSTRWEWFNFIPSKSGLLTYDPSLNKKVVIVDYYDPNVPQNSILPTFLNTNN